MRRLLSAAGLALPLVSLPLVGQEAPPAPPLEIGAVAPDFTLPGATRYGVLAAPVRLSDFQGKTVVLAFFFRARSKG